MNKIQHLVLSGGGAIGLKYIGILQELHRQRVWFPENLISVYGTSVGALVGAMVCLKHDWSTLVDYVVDRPWNSAFKIGVERVLTMVQRKGIFDTGDVEVILSPLLKSQDLSPLITMAEFYAHTGVDLHVFAFDVNAFSITDISYRTHGGLSLVKAVAMSCALPGLFSPVFFQDNDGSAAPECFIDGGFSCNYPLEFCMERPDTTPDSVLGLRKTTPEKVNATASPITADTPLIEYMAQFSANIIQRVAQTAPHPTVEWEVDVMDDIDAMSLVTLQHSINDSAFRAKLVEDGRMFAIEVVANKVEILNEEEKEEEEKEVIEDDI